MIKRHFVPEPGTALEATDWVTTDTQLLGSKKEVLYEMLGIEVPAWWNKNQINICSRHYLRQDNKGEQEKSFKTAFDRVASNIRDWGVADGILTPEEAVIFYDELMFLFVTGRAFFNSPVWYNVGIFDESQCSACFINSVEDDMDSIMKLASTEANIFKRGSGAGVNLSVLRGSNEPLSGGGYASGPVSFMRGYDSFAGVIKSGGRTRRAAKIIVLNIDHPDIEQFIKCKSKEEQKARELIAIGYSGGIDGDAYQSIFFQNANNSVRMTDSFMQAVADEATFYLINRGDGSKVPIPATKLWKEIARSAWECGDPGLQFHDTVDQWRTVDEPINGSNPCGEFTFIDNSACNLSSISLSPYKPARPTSNLEQGFKAADFAQTVRILVIAQDILVGKSIYPTEEITANSLKYRPLGLGYMDLGGLLVSSGIAYDSDRGRDIASALTSFMTAVAYDVSMDLAHRVWENSNHDAGAEPEGLFDCTRLWKVIEQHAEVWDNHKSKAAHPSVCKMWRKVMKRQGQPVRNAQVTLLAPTGTISFLSGADTTGIEPLLMLSTQKELVGGGELILKNKCVNLGLQALGYKNIEDIIGDSPDEVTFLDRLRVEDKPVFQTALSQSNQITIRGHLGMMAAVQPFLSGSISKTVNLPHQATEEDVAWTYQTAWELGLKSVTIYRDGSKASQPLEGKKARFRLKARREKLPNIREGFTHKFNIGGQEGYIHIGKNEDGEIKEFFVDLTKHGGALAGWADAHATICSIALQYGVPLSIMADKMKAMTFEPSGMVIEGHPSIKMATSTLDYLFRFLEEVSGMNQGVQDEPKMSNRLCNRCGHVLMQTGTCYTCTNCGDNVGGCG